MELYSILGKAGEDMDTGIDPHDLLMECLYYHLM